MTRSASALRRRFLARPPLLSAPRPLIWLLLALELTVSVWCLLLLAHLDASRDDWARLALIAALALAYEEGGKRVARLQIRLGPELKSDMTSVWAVAATIALPVGMSAVLLGGLAAYTWLQRDRPLGRPAYRTAFNAADAIVSSLTSAVVYRAIMDVEHSLLVRALAVICAIVVYTIVNRVIATMALLSLGVRGRELIGSMQDNLGELATLCLGGLVSLAVVHEPWLAILAVPPMVMLQRGALTRELETAATTDAKTGLYNAVTWEQIAQRELLRAERTGHCTAVMIVDLDRFKLVNDRFGHLAGDLVLRGIGQRMQTEVREYDTVGRFGGEEFVAVLPSAADVDALIVAERLRSRINTLRISDFVDDVSPDDDAYLAVSVGVACAPTDGTELTDLLHAADAALYRAKNIGRNRVMLAERGPGGSQGRRMHVA